MRRRIGTVALLGSAVALCAVAPAWAGSTERVSVSSEGVQGNGNSGGPSLSANGRFVAFASIASNLVPGDTNGSPDCDPTCGADVFVRDRQLGTTERVSVSSGGAQADGESFNPAISADGRFVAFQSDASNLVPGGTNGYGHVFLRDRVNGTTAEVDLGPGGVQGNRDSGYDLAISADGFFVAFVSEASNLVPHDTNGVTDAFVRDRRTGRTERISISLSGAQANGGSSCLSISADGRFVAFSTEASNLVPGDTNSRGDVFVLYRLQGQTGPVGLGPAR